MKSPREIELKLEVSEEDLKKLDSAVLKEIVGPNRPKIRTLTSVYFDTPEHKLYKHRLTLRVKRAGRKHLQTIKQDSDGEDSPFSRGEWETEIGSAEPNIEAARDTPLWTTLGKAGRQKLARVFATRVHRKSYLAQSGESLVELTIDRGEIEAGARMAPLCEIELELKRGEPIAIFRLARLVAARVPVWLALKSKSERGFELLNGTGGGAIKAAPVALTPDFTLEDAFRAIAWSCLGQLLANHPVFERGDAEGLHQMRVALRRLRAAISLFGDMLGDAQTATIKGELRWLGRELAPVREIDVLLARVAEAIDDAHPGNLGASDLNHDLGEQRAAAFERAKQASQSDRLRMLLIDVAAWIEAGDWAKGGDEHDQERRNAPIVVAATEQLSTRRKKILKRGKELKNLSADRRHRVRIQAKKLRYAAEFFAGAFPGKKAAKRRETFLRRLKTLQECLGELNDIVAHDILTVRIAERRRSSEKQKAGRKRAFAAGRLSGREQARYAPMLKAAEKAHAAFSETEPFWS